MYGTRLFDIDEVPAELLDCFEEVETKCGAPYERVVERQTEPRPTSGPLRGGRSHKYVNGGLASDVGTLAQATMTTSQTLGWEPTCTCNAGVQPCTVLDPFAGSGTTLAVALKFGRRAIGIDLDERNMALVHDRIAKMQPMLLDVTA